MSDENKWRRMWTSLFQDRTADQLDAIAEQIQDRCGKDTKPEEIEAALRACDVKRQRSAGSTYPPKAGEVIDVIWEARKASRYRVAFDIDQHRANLRLHAQRQPGRYVSVLNMSSIIPEQADASKLYWSPDYQSDQIDWWLGVIEREQDTLWRWQLICASRYAFPWLADTEGCAVAQNVCDKRGIAYEQYDGRHHEYQRVKKQIQERLAKA